MHVLSLIFPLYMLYLVFMYIEHVPNRNSPPAILLRESYRDGNKVKKRTLANLSSLPAEVIEGLKVLLRGGVAVSSVDDAFVMSAACRTGMWPPCSAQRALAAPSSGSPPRPRRCAVWSWRCWWRGWCRPPPSWPP